MRNDINTFKSGYTTILCKGKQEFISCQKWMASFGIPSFEHEIREYIDDTYIAVSINEEFSGFDILWEYVDTKCPEIKPKTTTRKYNSQNLFHHDIYWEGKYAVVKRGVNLADALLQREININVLGIPGEREILFESDDLSEAAEYVDADTELWQVYPETMKLDINVSEALYMLTMQGEEITEDLIRELADLERDGIEVVDLLEAGYTLDEIELSLCDNDNDDILVVIHSTVDDLLDYGFSWEEIDNF